MNGGDFLAKRKERWDELESLETRLESTHPKKISAAELERFVELYRTACSDLARVRSQNFGDDAEAFLNSIVIRGHKQFRRASAPVRNVLIAFFREDFPRAVRQMKFFVLASALLFIVPLILSAVIVYGNPPTAYSLTPADALEQLTDHYAAGHEKGRSESEDSAMAGFYIRNNIGVAFQCFAMGIFLGVGSIFALIYNGISIGAVGAYICASGYSESFISFVSGHGSFELTAIVLSGAMGLRIGMLLLNPGPWTRADAFKVHGPAILQVVLGSAAMLLIAAFIEGFWSPSSVSTPLKLGVAATLWGLVILYLVFSGRKAAR